MTKFIELTNSYKRSYSKKFSLNINNILYFSSYVLTTKNDNYNECNSIVETLGGSEGSQIYYVEETYDQLKGMLNNAL